MWPFSARADRQTLKAAANREAALRAAVLADVEKGKLPPNALPPNPTAETGISGTANYFGDLQHESNNSLIHQQAYGQAGTRIWGEWETIIRTDPAVASSLDFTAAQLRDARVDVEEADEDVMPDRALAKAQADFVRWNLLEAMSPGWAEVIQQMTRGPLGYGFSLHERIYRVGSHKSLPGGQGYVLKALNERLPSSIHVNGWLENDAGELTAVRQQGPRPGMRGVWETVDVPASKLVLVTWNRNGNNYLGFSAFRSVWYMCKVRWELLKLVAISLTREAAGVPIATSDSERAEKLDAPQREALQKLLANLVYHENASVVMPRGWNMSWVYSPGANKGHVIDAYNALGTIIMQQVQAQQQGLGVNGEGNRAVGQVHDAGANAFVQGVSAVIEGVINGVGDRPYTGVVPQLIAANWGSMPDGACPKVRIVLRQAKLSVTDFADAVGKMKGAGAISVWRLADENTAREKAGLGPLTEVEWDEEQQRKDEAKAAMAQQLEQQSQTPPPKPGQPSPTQPPKPGFPQKPAQASRRLRAGSLGGFVPHRPLRAAEKHLDLPAMDTLLTGARVAFEKGAKPLLAAMVLGVQHELTAAMADRAVAHEEIAKLPLDTSKLSAFVGTFLQKYRAAGYAHVAAELARAKPARTQPLRADKKKKPAPANDVTLEAQQLALVRRMESRTRAALESSAIDVVRTGGSSDDVVNDVLEGLVDSKALQADGGSISARAYNIGRDDFINEHADEVDSMELSAVLDSDTCDYCEEHDGDEFELGSSDEEAMTPPLNDCGDGYGQCRCVVVVQWVGGNGFKDVTDESTDDTGNDGEGGE